MPELAGPRTRAPRAPVLRGPRDWPLLDPGSRDEPVGPVASTAPYVDVTTGDVVLQQTDVELPGWLPLVLRRTYRSSWHRPGWFGPTWSSLLDERLLVHGDEAVWVRADATTLRLPLPAPGRGAVTESGPPVALRRSERGALVLLDAASGVERHFLGSADQLLAAVVDRRGQRVSVVRDARGVPLEVRHSGGYRVLVETVGRRVTGLRVAPPQRPGPGERWSGGQPAEDEVAPGSRVRRFDYDAAGHLATASLPLDEGLWLEAHLRHDVDGRLLEVSGDAGAVRLEHDDHGRCVRLGAPDGAWHQDVSYVEADGVLRETRSGSTTWLLDARGRVVAEEHRDRPPVTYAWDDRDRMVSRTDAAATTTWRHDASSRVVEETRPDGTGTRWEYREALGSEPVAVHLPDGGTWTQELDRVGSPRSTVDPCGATTRWRVDAEGRRAELDDALGATTRLVLDATGATVRETRPDGATQGWRRDERGRVVTHVDPAGARTELTWGPWDLSSRTDPGREARHRRWSRLPEGGLLRSETDADGHTTETRFRADGTRDGAHGGHVPPPDEASSASRTDDPAGRAVRLERGDDTVALSRDGCGRVLEETVTVAGRTTSVVSSYDAAGRRLTRRLPGGLAEEWTYGVTGRPRRLDLETPGQVHRIDLEHDACGRLRGVRVADGCAVDQVWEPDGRLAHQTCRQRAAGSASAGGSPLEAKLGAPPGAASSETVTLERSYAWSAAGRWLDPARPARPSPRTASREDPLGRATVLDGARVTWDGGLPAEVDRPGRTTWWVMHDGAPLLHVVHEDGRSRVHVVLLDAERSPWAMVDEQGEPCWTAAESGAGLPDWPTVAGRSEV